MGAWGGHAVGVVVDLKEFRDKKLAPKPHDPTKFYFGDRIKASPVGAGVLTGASDVGYPQVNTITVAWCIRADGLVFDPNGITSKPDFNEENWYVVKL